MSLDPSVTHMAQEGLVTFMIAERPFAIPIGLVREINRQLDLTKVYQAPRCVRGLVNLRGQIVTVVDLSERIGLGASEVGEKIRLVVLKETSDLRGEIAPGVGVADDPIGFLVDSISDVLSPERDDLESPPSNLDQSEGRHLIAVCKTEAMTVGVLNPASLIKSIVTGSDLPDPVSPPSLDAAVAG